MNEIQNEKQKQKLKNNEIPNKMKNEMGKKEKQKQKSKSSLGIEPGSPVPRCLMSCAVDRSTTTTHKIQCC